jgi:hypothetical protein
MFIFQSLMSIDTSSFFTNDNERSDGRLGYLLSENTVDITCQHI